MRGARARRRRGAFKGVVQRVAHPFAHRFEHAQVDAPAQAVDVALEQRGQDVAAGVHAGGDVGNRQTGLAGFFGGAGEADEAALALDQQVAGLLVAAGAGRLRVVAIARDVADDEVGPAALQRSPRHPQPRCRAGRQVVHHAVGLVGDELDQQCGRAWMLDVQRLAFLAAVGPHEVRSQAAHTLVVAACKVTRAGAFDLDHARTQVGQLAGGERRRDGVFERDDSQALERLHRVSPSRSPRRPW